MKSPSLRFNVRRIAIALVVVALIVVLEVGRRRRGEFLEKASEFGIAERSSLLTIQLVEQAKPARKPDLSKVDVQRQGPITAYLDEDPAVLEAEKQAQLVILREKAAVQTRIRQKYERAASFPWLSVERDPAEPAPNEGPSAEAIAAEKAANGEPAPTRGSPAPAPAKKG